MSQRNQRQKIIIWLVALLVPATAVVGILLLHSISQELDEKFYASIDSIPTRVFSRVFWIKPGVGASLEELRYRLKERDYREVKDSSKVQMPGQFCITEDAATKSFLLNIYTQDFDYPAPVKELVVGQSSVDTKPQRFEVVWRSSEVESIHRDGKDDVSGFALEPVLVAQLSGGRLQARKAVPLSDIPHTLLKAIVLVEDQRFLEHAGVDPRGILRSIYVNLREGGFRQGASTITQQLTRNIYLNRQRSLKRKIKEMLMSLMLEFKFSKDQILEKYLNEVYYGQSGNISIHGVAEAAKFYFGKSLEEITIAEQALLAGLVRGPFYYSPLRYYDRAKSRQEIILKKMVEAGVITEQQYKSAVKERLRFAKINAVQNRAPYFTDIVQAELLLEVPEAELVGGGYTIFSTVDTYYQGLAEKSVGAFVDKLEERQMQYLNKRKKEEDLRILQGIFMAVDPANGQLLSLVGGRSYEESTYNRALLMRRQVGSLMKPFVYLAALINAKDKDGNPVNAVTKYEDKPFTYQFDGKAWSPKNYEDDFMGTVTLRYALANSINTVAAQVGIQAGLDHVVEVAKAAGFDTALLPYPSLTLGAVDVSPLEVLHAYLTLTNFGMKKEVLSFLAAINDSGRVILHTPENYGQVLPKEETANLVQLMTTTVESGTAKASRELGFSWPAAGKTGTTNDFRDAWFAGFSSKLLGISWVGFDRDDDAAKKQRKALRLTGAVAALPIWVDFMKNVHKDQLKHPLSFPEGALRTMKVDLISGGKATFTCQGPSVVEETFTERNQPRYDCE